MTNDSLLTVVGFAAGIAVVLLMLRAQPRQSCPKCGTTLNWISLPKWPASIRVFTRECPSCQTKISLSGRALN